MENTKRIHLLSSTYVEELYARPEFNTHEQRLYFTLNKSERTALAQLSIALSVSAQFSLKAGMSGVEVREALAQPLTLLSALTILTNQYVIVGFALYGLGAVVWLGVLSEWDVSKAYPLVGLGFVFTVLIGFIAGEQVTLARVAGVVLICAGAVLVGRS